MASSPAAGRDRTVLRDSFSIVRLTKLPDDGRDSVKESSGAPSDSVLGNMVRPRDSGEVSMVVPESGFMGRCNGDFCGEGDIIGDYMEGEEEGWRESAFNFRRRLEALQLIYLDTLYFIMKGATCIRGATILS